MTVGSSPIPAWLLGLFGRRRDPDWPACVQLELLNVCNLRCPLCALGKGPRVEPVFFPLDSVRQLVGQIQGVPELFTLYGRMGEPLLHPEIVEIVHAVHEIGPTRSRISSNGTLLRGALMQRLIESPLTELIIAVDGATARTYEKYRKGGDFKELCRNISAATEARARLGRKRPKLTTQFIPMAHNEHETEAFLRLSEALGCDGARIKISGSVCRSSRFRPQAPDPFPGRTATIESGHCGMRKIYVDCHGELFPCCYGAALPDPSVFRLGRIDDGLQRVRHGSVFRQLSRALARKRPPRLCIDKCIANVNRKYYRFSFR